MFDECNWVNLLNFSSIKGLKNSFFPFFEDAKIFSSKEKGSNFWQFLWVLESCLLSNKYLRFSFLFLLGKSIPFLNPTFHHFSLTILHYYLSCSLCLYKPSNFIITLSFQNVLLKVTQRSNFALDLKRRHLPFRSSFQVSENLLFPRVKRGTPWWKNSITLALVDHSRP